jgi:hypothetical protein
MMMVWIFTIEQFVALASAAGFAVTTVAFVNNVLPYLV